MTKIPQTGGRPRPGPAKIRRAAPRRVIGNDGIGRRRDLAARGQAYGFAALVFILVTVVVLAVIGQPWLAGLVVTTGLVGVVGIFVTGRFPTRAGAGAEAGEEPEVEPPP